MGITARWPQVVNVWEIPGGWDGWFGKVDRLGLKRASNTDLNAWWKQAFEYRSGGFDRLLGAVPGCPNIESLTRDGVTGSLFVHELTEVAPGHRARVPGSGARGAGAAPRRVRPSTRRPVRGDDERLRGVHDLGHHRRRRTCARPRPATSHAASPSVRAPRVTRDSRSGTPGRGPGPCTGARSS